MVVILSTDLVVDEKYDISTCEQCVEISYKDQKINFIFEMNEILITKKEMIDIALAQFNMEMR